MMCALLCCGACRWAWTRGCTRGSSCGTRRPPPPPASPVRAPALLPGLGLRVAASACRVPATPTTHAHAAGSPPALPGRRCRPLLTHTSPCLLPPHAPRHATPPCAGPHCPQHLLEVAYLSTTARGSSTACILCLENERLHASNLGDSGAAPGGGGAALAAALAARAWRLGARRPRLLLAAARGAPASSCRQPIQQPCSTRPASGLPPPLPPPPGFMVIRGGELVFMSPQQQHEFNFPYQIGSPDSMSDTPAVAQRFSVEVRPAPGPARAAGAALRGPGRRRPPARRRGRTVPRRNRRDAPLVSQPAALPCCPNPAADLPGAPRRHCGGRHRRPV